MLSINMRVFKTVLLLVVFISSRVECLPVANETTIVDLTTVLPSSSEVDHYDQRQNGTENFRVHVDGVVFVFAPVEALLLANAAGNKPNLPIPDPSKPTPGKPEIEHKPLAAPKSTNRIGSHLTNLLAPFLPALRRE